MPDIIELPNPYGKIYKQSKTVQRQQDKLEQWNHKASKSNEDKRLELNKVKYTNNLFLLCRLCSSKLVRKKSIIKEIGLSTIEVPSYVCSLCHTKYSGFLPHVKHMDNPELEAEIVEFHTS